MKTKIIRWWKGHAVVADVGKLSLVDTACGEKSAPADEVRSGWPPHIHCPACLTALDKM